MADLGSILNPQTPPIVPAEAARTSPLGPGGGAGIMDFLKRPEMAAFMAQMGASLLAGRGAKALADGGSAVGRYSVGQMEAKKEQEDRDRKIFESDREYELRVKALEKSGRGGGGGGSGGGGGDSDITVAGMKPEAIAKQLYADDLKEWQTAKENEELSGVPAGPRPDPLAYRYRSDVIKKAIASGVTMEQLKQVELDFNNQRAAATAPGSGAPSEGPVGAGPATATPAPTTPAAPIDPTSGRPLPDVSPFGGTTVPQYGGGPQIPLELLQILQNPSGS